MMPENKIEPGIFSFFEWKHYSPRVSKWQDKQKGNSACLSGACVGIFNVYLFHCCIFSLLFAGIFYIV